MNETVLVVFVILIILFLGMFLFYKYNFASLKELGGTLNEQQVSILLATITTNPGIACSDNNCLDTAKFLPYQQYTKGKTIYGNKKIYVQTLYPTYNNATCTIQTYNQLTYPNNCNTWILYQPATPGKQAIKISTPISLYYPETATYTLGQLTIEVYP